MNIENAGSSFNVEGQKERFSNTMMSFMIHVVHSLQGMLSCLHRLSVFVFD